MNDCSVWIHVFVYTHVHTRARCVLRLSDHRKVLILFAWDHLKSTFNTLTRQWAYVHVCRFIEAYETPSKIVLQVYVALLRSFQRESANLVKKALETLMPTLPRR